MRSRCLVLLMVAACQGSLKTSETAQESVVVTPTTWDFGSLEIGMTSVPRSISVNPAIGNNYDTVTAVTESCPDFSVSAPGLPAEVFRVCEFTNTVPQAKPSETGTQTDSALPCVTTEYQTYTFSTTFSPNVGGATSCVVTIVTNNTTSRTITLSGTGTIPPVKVDVSPPSVGFGDVRRNTTSSAATIDVRNLGGQNMAINSATVSAGFSIVSGPPSTTVAPSATQPYGVVCMPTAVGAMSGSFVVNTNDPARPSVTVPLTCRGIDSNLDISPSPAMLPTTRVGEPVEATINLVNTGAASMTLVNVTLESTDLELSSAPGANTVLAPNASAPARIRFAAASAATASGTLQITYDGAEVRTSQITARALATSMALTPDGDVNLGPICLGQMKSQPFTIIANADADFQITDITAPAAPFTLTAPTLPATVRGAGATTTMFEVRAEPTEAGALSSTMTVVTDIPGEPTREIRLVGTALSEGVSGAPETLDLGSQPLDMTTIGEELALANCTAASTSFSNARIEGIDASSFAIVQQPTTSTLPPNGVAKWLVVFTPRTKGPKTATFLVDYDGGTATIALTGEGLGGLLGDGPPSYYACNVGGHHAWPLALVFALLIRRRRRR